MYSKYFSLGSQNMQLVYMFGNCVSVECFGSILMFTSLTPHFLPLQRRHAVSGRIETSSAVT